MDASKHDEPPSFTSQTPTPLPPPIDPWPDRLNHSSMAATPLPTSPSARSSSRLSPSDMPPRSGAAAPHLTPRRTTSSSSLRDERRKSIPSLKKRSSTASLRSIYPSAGGSSCPSLSRRSSSTFATSPATTTTPATNTPNTSLKRPSLHAAMEHPIPTAASIAADHFQKEVDLHQSADLRSQTLVVLHDACYGHRFSRPRTSRAALNSIVERPERIQAGVLGVSAAYVRLTRRYSGGLFAPHPDLSLEHLPVPPFQIRKTARVMALNSPAVTHVHGTKWMDDLKSMCDGAESRLALNGKELIRPRSAGKDGATADAPPLHEGDLYLCSESLNAFEGALGGVCESIDAVFGPGSTKRAFVCIRPPGHHCSAGHPSGFCWINNVHVGISYAAMSHGLTHAAILDFDLHHGDGSQEIAWEQNQKATTAARNAANYKKAVVGYFSLHDINSYPCEMGDPEKVRNASVCIDGAHGQSTWNVHLEPWKTDLEFWELYATKYTILIEKARAFLRTHTERLLNAPNGPPPKAAIFISAGFDASEWEGAGMQRHKVNVPTDFYARFTADVVRMAEEEGLGVDGRIVSVLEGGYSNRALTSGVLSHLSGLGDSAFNADNTGDNQINRLTAEMADRLALFDPPQDKAQYPIPEAAYDGEWWSPAALEELEALVYPPAAPPKVREKSAPTYFAPTQSFTAKVVTYPRDQDLNAEASRLRRERLTTADTAPSTAPEESRMKLRTRKPKSSLPSTPNAETPKRQMLKGNRRTTIDATSDLPGPSPDEKSPTMRATRRKSAASTTIPTSDPGVDHAKIDSNQRPSSRIANGGRKQNHSRPTTPKRSVSPRKVPPVPRVPSGFLPSEPAGDGPSRLPDGSHPQTDSTEALASDDVDSLAAGVRKLSIKLKVPSPEENVARENKMAEERKKRSSKAAIKMPKLPKKPSGAKASTSTSRPSSRSSSTPTSSGPSTVTVQARTSSITKSEEQERAPSSSLETLETSSSAAGGFAVASLHDRPSAARSVEVLNPPSSQAPLGGTASLTPESLPSTVQLRTSLYSPPTSAVLNRNGLPVFTSNSPIPFAPSSAVQQSETRTPSELDNSTFGSADSEQPNGLEQVTSQTNGAFQIP
ncbi:hypothetical protein EYZ11_008748 [Aspergillus tanneri]|uniref:Histone deacetylase domain-containing protein n=1 Tax=Aspergillus tanneri TaxID=1220188 RepID=A0A4S3J9R7_9EURO|nr:hypothetical protein EYZ11_008748 [Aspergillus tanneri]